MKVQFADTLQNVSQFSEPALIVNAACCSSSTVKCPKCAAAALNANFFGRGGGTVAPTQKTDPDMLPIPTMADLFEEQPQTAATPESTTEFVANVPDYLRGPTML